MSENVPYLIVGGGIAGLLAAKTLKDQGFPFLGLEREERLGGRVEVGHHRLYEENSTRFLTKHFSDLQWTQIQEDAKERRKGEWHPVGAGLPEREDYFLKSPFYRPSIRYSELLHKLVEEVGEHFQIRRAVTKVFPSKKIVQCEGGFEFSYDKLIWCSRLELLSSLWEGNHSGFGKLLEQLEENAGGIVLDLETQDYLPPCENTVLFPFRYKDKRLHALGQSELEEQSSRSFNHWTVFLEDELFEDREEVAKCVRALKRELYREFPDLQQSIKNEKIVYLSTISGETPAPSESLAILPDLYYVGPQVALPNSNPELFNLDRTLDNCREFEAVLGAASH